jgi:WD40 repeat protein
MQFLKDRKIKDIHEGEIQCLALNETSNFFATCADEEPVLIRKYPFMKLIKKIVHREHIPAEDDELEYNLIKNRNVSFDISKNNEEAGDASQKIIKGPIISASKILFSNSGSLFYIGYQNGDLLIFNTKSWEKIIELNLEIGICNIQLSQDESLLYVINLDCDIIIIETTNWEIQEKKQIKTPNTGYGILSQDATTLFTVADKKRVRSIDVTSLDEKLVFKGHKSGINKIRLSPDESMLATCGNDNKICIFDAQTGDLRHLLLGHSDEVYSMVFTSDNQYLISSSEDYTLRLWDLNSYKTIKTLEEVPNARDLLLVKNFLISGNVDGEIRFFRFNL